MKKINIKKALLIVALASIINMGNIFSKELSEVNQEFLDFIDFEKNTKDSWLSYARDYHTAKMNLIIKHNNENFDLWKKGMEEKFSSNKEYTAESLQKKLDDMVTLHEKQASEWKTLCTKWQEKGQKMYEEKTAELKKFKAKDETKETTEEEIPEVTK